MDALMARLESGDTSAFEQLAKALVSPDNQARGQAETFYKQLFDVKPDIGIQYLCRGLSDEKPDMKHFCCVYLRKAVRGTGVWDACSPDTKELVKSQGIKCLAEENNPALTSKLADCMSQVAAQTWGNEQERWNGLLQHMQQFIASDDPRRVEVALVLFSKLTEWLDQDDLLQHQASQMYNVLIRCLQHNSHSVQLAACKASINFITSFEDENAKLKLDGLVPPIFQVISAQLVANQEHEVRDILMDLLDIAEHEPRLFKRNCREHVALLLAIMSGRDPSNPSLALDSETRSSAMELVITIVENRPGLVRKDEAQMHAICESLMALLLEIEDTELWHTAIEEEDLDDGQSELYEGALQGLDRIAKPIGGKFLLSSLWPLIEQWAKDGDWRKRSGALCAIAQVAEGCRKALLPHAPLDALMKLCCAAVSDSNAFVKWSACQAIGQICTDLATKVQRKHHESIMKALMHLMGGTEEPRVQSHAASAIVNFCEGLGDEDGGNIVSVYLQPLTERLLELLRSGNQLAVEAALTATSSISDGVGELFRPYYASIMPLLKHILVSCNGKTQRRLCGKTLECISLIAMSVGKETFFNDARDFLHYLQELNTMEMADDDPLVTYVQSAGTRMCKCLGEDFVPMLSTFVPPLIRSAGRKSTYEMVNADEVEDDEDEEDYTSYPVGDKIFRVSTAGTEEKTNALSMLMCYAEHLGKHFAPFCMEIARIVEHVLSAPLLNTETMRRTCASLVPQLLSCMQSAAESKSWEHANPAAVAQLFELLMKGLLSAMDCEVDPDVLHELYTALEDTLDDSDEALITPGLLEGFFPKIEAQVKRLLAARQERAEAKADEEFDEEDLELIDEAEEQEEELLQQVAASIGAFLKRMGDTALPSVEKLMQEYLNPLLMDPSRRPEERWVPLLVVSDCIEYAPSSAKHLPSVLPQIVANAQIPKPELVQVCAYTLGVVAEKHPSVYSQHHTQLLPIIVKLIEQKREEEEWQQAHDNAVGALGRVLFHHEAQTSDIHGKQLATLWLNCLPLYCDEDEAGKQHNLLHQFLMRNDTRILGDNNANLKKIAEIFVRVIGRRDSLLKEDSAKGFVQFFLQQLRPVLEANGCNLQELVQILEPKDQYRFSQACEGGA